MMLSRFMGIALICGIALTVMHQSTCYADVRTHEVRKDKAVLVQHDVYATSITLTRGYAFDHLFVCTASVPAIFVLPRVLYAAARNILDTAPSKEVEARCNSPGHEC